MKKSTGIKRFLAVLFTALFILALVPTGDSYAATKKGWVTKKGHKYYYNDSGKQKKGFVTVGKNTYYFTPKAIKTKKGDASVTINPKGSMVRGWFKLDGKYYYFNRSNGKMVKNKTIDGIKIAKDGTAKKTDYNEKKMNLMILARERMQSLTKPSDSKEVKREACYDYVKDNFTKTAVNADIDGKNQMVVLENIRSRADWDIIFADFGLSKNHGDCVAWACSVAYLIHECGYDDVYIVDDKKGTGYDSAHPAHAWAECEGKVFDAYFGSYKGKDSNYNTGYACNKTGSFPDWPINKKNVATGEATSAN